MSAPSANPGTRVVDFWTEHQPGFRFTSREPGTREFFDEVASKLGGFRGVIIVGPGTARTEFAGHIAHLYPMLAKRVWGIEAMDHPTDAQIVAVARKFFRAADRMHRA